MQEKLIISDPAIKLGRPVVAGTRVTVDEILDQLAAGATADDVIERHPALSIESITAALAYAADAVRADSPLAASSPLALHGAHLVSSQEASTGKSQTAIAVRTFLPDAAAVSVHRPPQPSPTGRAWFPSVAEESPAAEADAPAAATLHPMERIHPAGVFEAIFPGESQPFPYQLAVTSPQGETRLINAPHGLPPCVTSADLPPFAESSGREAGPVGGVRHACRRHEVLGAHLVEHAGFRGTAFAVWAPDAASVSVIGDFNAWNALAHPMRPVGGTGVWELFAPGIEAGARYKYRITAGEDGRQFDRADPYAFAAELRPRTASVVWPLGGYRWHDEAWLQTRRQRQSLASPIAIYEVHLGSWRRPKGANADGTPLWLTYRELADRLVPYVKELGYTHIEPMPVAEHPFDGSWGYQVTGFFAPTARHGTPDDFRYFVDTAHQAGLGVILDWVPGHFPKDAHGLARFDGSHLYEHADPRRSENLEWGTLSFNLGRDEVNAFLLSNALYWVEHYHVDGLRVDAVSSMVYLDYSRQHWMPNEFGGRENLEATAFLQRLNALIHREHPGVLMIAEESTAWPHVTGREIPDSLGFDLKWNLGWMHDTLGYAQKDPIFRRHHHHNLTFSLTYAFNESFLLPFSHDEVVHGKRSLLAKMPGDPWQQFANLRTLYGYMYTHPGKKLHFMGSEFGPMLEWNHDAELDWSLLERTPHAQLSAYVKALNRLYVSHPAMHEVDFSWAGFQWIDCDDADRSIVSFIRRGKNQADFLVVVVNFTPVPREDYRLGLPAAGVYGELLNSDAAAFGGGDLRNPARLPSEPTPANGQPHSIAVTLPPLGIMIFGRVGEPADEPTKRRRRRRRRRGTGRKNSR